MAGARLTFEERKSILKWYIKFENVAEVQRQWKRDFHSRFHWRWKLKLRKRYTDTICYCVYIFMADPVDKESYNLWKLWLW
jgi:hypothetical protein